MEADRTELTGCCLICGAQGDEHAKAVWIPKIWVHGECYYKDPYAALEASRQIVCCDAKTTLQSLGGCLVQRRKDVPAGEIWLWDNGKLQAFNCETFDRLPDPIVPKASSQHQGVPSPLDVEPPPAAASQSKSSVASQAPSDSVSPHTEASS